MQTVLRWPSIPMGIGRFQPPPPQNRYPWTGRQKNSLQLIKSSRGTPIPNLVQIHLLVASGKTGEMYQKLDFIYLFICLSVRLSLCLSVCSSSAFCPSVRLSIYLFYLYFFLRLASADHTRGWILRMISHASMCLFGVIKLKYNIKPLFFPKTVKIWPKNGRFFSPENA